MHVGLYKDGFGAYAPWRPLPPGSVVLREGFWSRPRDVNRTAGLRHGYAQLERAGNFHNLKVAGGMAKGEFVGKVFWDSDVYKWLEAIAYELAREPDADLRRMADETIPLIEAAQLSDGYLDSYFTIAEPDRRWQDLTRGHEMYCAGHLIEAAVAFNRFLGEDRLLRVAVRFADHIDSTFGPGKRAGTPGHPEIELALVELYRETGERRYLDLSLYLLNQRGKGLLDPGAHGGHGGPGVYQDHAPVRDASSMEGHAVRQLYLMSGIADVYLETGEAALLESMHRLWEDMTLHKTFIHGGVGSIHSNEAFSEPYELPNSRAYCETCAQIASIMWNWRLLMGSGDGAYADSIENALYNAFLSGVSLGGDRFFYVNTLLSRGQDPVISRKRIERMEWPWTPCCPPNVMRFLAMLDHHVATSGDGGVQLHQYMPATIEAKSGSGGSVRLNVETRYPWEGTIQISVEQADGSSWPMMLRVPAWAQEVQILLDGQEIEPPREKGYARIMHTWKPGNSVELRLGLHPTLYEAHPQVDSAAGSVAIKRGPVLYCLEQADQGPGVDVLVAGIDESATLHDVWVPDLLGGVVTIEVDGFLPDGDGWRDRLYRPLETGPNRSGKPIRLKAIPYYAWANRGPNAMKIWIPRAGGR